MIWIIGILIYSLFTRDVRRKKIAVISATLLLLFFSNEYIVNKALLFWEEPPVSIANLQTGYTAILLTGVTESNKSPKDRIYYNKGADRVLHTLQLYRAGKVKSTIISGGAALMIGEQIPEAESLKKTFLDAKIPSNAIILETESRNTRENALFTKKIIDSLNLKGPFLLVTSAFHMKRAKGCFKKVGTAVTPYPADYYSTDGKFTPDYFIIPSERALSKWSLLIHEVLGYWVYRMMGYSIPT
ncbi:MAG: YdcF family protein [Sporocytophaga sp.]|uniref:YdcF family protein n=1 Tax=Sporocytophaga sp. TaxID=2231183 RepID=UPI001B2EDF3A|nr:YdcF family protein [Sporocytophaga sp.]MBO9700271.1 YdcF family protein [Sporocytophaga sp.]